MSYQLKEMSRFNPDAPDMRVVCPEVHPEHDEYCRECEQLRYPQEMATDTICYYCKENL